MAPDMQRKLPFLMTGVATAALVFGTTSIALSGEDGEAPLPTCERSPTAPDQGDDIVVRGHRWEDDSTVTVAFDGEDADEATSGTDDTADDSLDDDVADETDDQNVVTDDVSSRGRFRVEFTIPDGAARGIHSINVTGTDRDGLEATCARLVRLDNQPEVSTSGTTSTSGENGEPGGGSTTSSSSSTTSTTSP